MDSDSGSPVAYSWQGSEGGQARLDRMEMRREEMLTLDIENDPALVTECKRRPTTASARRHPPPHTHTQPTHILSFFSYYQISAIELFIFTNHILHSPGYQLTHSLTRVRACLPCGCRRPVAPIAGMALLTLRTLTELNMQ